MVDYARDIRAKVQVVWPTSGTVDETDYLLNMSGQRRIAPPEKSIMSTQGQIGRASVTLANNGRFSVLNTGGALYSDIGYGSAHYSPVILSISTDGGSTYEPVFRGVIRGMQETTIHPNNTPAVVLDVRGREEEFINERLSTLRSTFASDFDDGATESDYISAWLDSSLTAGEKIIDDGWLTIPYGWLDDDSPIEGIWQMAAAAGGRFYFDRGGTAHYERLDHWLYSPHDTSQRTFSRGNPDLGYESLSIRYETQELYKEVIVEFTGRQIDPSTVIWTPEEPIQVPAASAIGLVVEFSSPIYTAPTISYQATTAGGTDISSDVAIPADPLPTGYTDTGYAQRSIITIENNNATEAAILRQFEITARPVTSDNTAQATSTSTDGFWTGKTGITRRIRANKFVQYRAQAQALAEFLKDRYETPRKFYLLRGCVGDPSLELGDRIEINDDNQYVTFAAEDGYITSIGWRYDGSFSQDIEAIGATSEGQDDYFAYGTADYFIIGTDTLADSNSDRTFY